MLIGIVILLIIIVSATIFLGGNAEETASKQELEGSMEPNQSANKEKSERKHDAKNKDEQNVSEEDDQAKEDSDSHDENDDLVPEDEETAVISIGGDGENIKRTIENPKWKPVGTSQSGEHTSVFETDSVDWAEMKQAISYATGVSQDDLTIWFLGNNGFNKAVGTISSKSSQEKYRVYMEWINEEGWKPTKVEELYQIDKN